MTTAAVVLAAGEGSRFLCATHKLLAPFRGRPLWTWAVDAAVDANLDATYVVTGAIDLPIDAPAVAVRNDAWARGQATSLAAGVAAVSAASATPFVAKASEPAISHNAYFMV